MIGGGAFILLKIGRKGAESAKQAETRFAPLRTILAIPGKCCREASRNARVGCGGAIFRWTWLMQRIRADLLSTSQF